MIDAEPPPPPDPTTGLPRPPRAPELDAPAAEPPAGPVIGSTDGPAPTDPARPQSWFHDTPGPVLETVRGPRAHPVRFAARYPAYAAVSLAFPMGFYLGGNALWTPNFDLGSTARVLGTIAAILLAGHLLVSYLMHRHQVIYTGARWIGDGAGREQSVTTYDLTHIMITGTGANSTLRLTGTNNVTLRLPLALMRSNPPLWDLLYNGLLHSAVGGASIDPDTRRRLLLPPARTSRP